MAGEFSARRQGLHAHRSSVQCRITNKPGDCLITCGFGFDEPSVDKGQTKPVVKSRFRLEILDPTPEQIAGNLDELVAEAHRWTTNPGKSPCDCHNPALTGS